MVRIDSSPQVPPPADDRSAQAGRHSVPRPGEAKAKHISQRIGQRAREHVETARAVTYLKLRGVRGRLIHSANAVKLIARMVVYAIKEVFLVLRDAIVSVANRVFKSKQVQQHGLLRTSTPVRESERAFMTNLAAMRDIVKRGGGDPEVEARLQFLAANYLAKAAPAYIDQMRFMDSAFDKMSQVNPLHAFHYHRYGFMEDLSVGDPLNAELALSESSPVIPTETDQFAQLFPLRFEAIEDPSDTQAVGALLLKAVSEHLEAHADENNPLKAALARPLLFDMTEMMPAVRTYGVEALEQNYEHALDDYHSQLQEQIRSVASVLHQMHPDLSASKIRRFLRANMTHIHRVPPAGSTSAGVKILPVFRSLPGDAAKRYHHDFLDFIGLTGLFTGAVTARRGLLRKRAVAANASLAIGPHAVREGPLAPGVFSSPTALLQTDAFRQFEQIPTLDGATDDVRLMAGATSALIRGVCESITQEQWHSLTPVMQEVLQYSLVQLKDAFSEARLHCRADSAKFEQAIELAHAELATILELTRPFGLGDFEPLHLANLGHIPPILKPMTRAGLGKTGVNMFAAVNAAILPYQPAPVRAYGEGFYFEQAGFVGYDRNLDAILEDDSVEQVDLFACQFNANIDIDPERTHYEPGPVVSDIRRILTEKPNTQHMTVTVDCTIDYLNSPQVQELLEEFEEEIESGKLNFVFFRSGQKFDMFGMDNYYGAPFYVVNNGGEPWEHFADAMKQEAFQTDPLSYQWFCAANRFAGPQLDEYRRLIFDNARNLLDRVPENLRPKPAGEKQPKIRVNSMSEQMESCYIDLKITGPFHKLRAKVLFAQFHAKCLKAKVKSLTRASIGFYHPSLVVIQINELKGSTTLRICPGINAKENDAIVDFLESLA